MNIPINIQRIHPDTPIPEYKTAGAVGFDIALPEGGRIEPGECKTFPTGLVIQVPKGHALILTARSSTAKKGLMLANGVGTIDQDYFGPENQIHLSLRNFGDKPYDITPGERLAQGLVLPVAIGEFHETVFTGENRGSFGSTG